MHRYSIFLLQKNNHKIVENNFKSTYYDGKEGNCNE